ncbi:MAG TPA: hypothetical protein VFZ69_03995 [Longimicrobiales bacterium]
MTSDSASDAARRAFRRTLLRVMAVQLVTISLLWLLQETFTR